MTDSLINLMLIFFLVNNIKDINNFKIEWMIKEKKKREAFHEINFNESSKY